MSKPNYDHNETNGHTHCFSLISKYKIRLKAALLDIKIFCVAFAEKKKHFNVLRFTLKFTIK